jgi:histone acetyltransferase 1
LPPYQKKGHGKRLYSYLYNLFLCDPQVHDITVEDPNDAFQDMRDRSDVSMLLENNVLELLSKESLITPSDSTKMSTSKMFLEPKSKITSITLSQIKYLIKTFKLCEKQIVRCMEIVLLSSIKSWDITSYTNFRLYVKKRLYKKNKDVLNQVFFA